MNKVLSVIATTVVAFIAYAMIGVPTTQAADLPDGPRVVRTQKVVWVQVDLPETTARTVRIEFLTPRVNGARQRWQYCEMEYVGLGTYRCGLHIGGDTPARSMTGRWLGKLSIDGDAAGLKKFRTTQP